MALKNDLEFGFSKASAWVQLANTWEETQHRMQVGTYPYLQALKQLENEPSLFVKLKLWWLLKRRKDHLILHVRNRQLHNQSVRF